MMLPLGKCCIEDENGKPLDWEFGGFLDNNGERIDGERLLKMIARFLILNVEKECRLIYEAREHLFVSDDEYDYISDSYDRLMRVPVEPILDQLDEPA